MWQLFPAGCKVLELFWLQMDNGNGDELLTGLLLIKERSWLVGTVKEAEPFSTNPVLPPPLSMQVQVWWEPKEDCVNRPRCSSHIQSRMEDGNGEPLLSLREDREKEGRKTRKRRRDVISRNAASSLPRAFQLKFLHLQLFLSLSLSFLWISFPLRHTFNWTV